jgi:hypothetical protein
MNVIWQPEFVRLLLLGTKELEASTTKVITSKLFDREKFNGNEDKKLPIRQRDLGE